MLNGSHEQVGELQLLAPLVLVAPLEREENLVVSGVEADIKGISYATYLFEFAKLRMRSERFQVVQRVYVIKYVAVVGLGERIGFLVLLKEFPQNLGRRQLAVWSHFFEQNPQEGFAEVMSDLSGQKKITPLNKKKTNSSSRIEKTQK